MNQGNVQCNDALKLVTPNKAPLHEANRESWQDSGGRVPDLYLAQRLKGLAHLQHDIVEIYLLIRC